MSYTSDLDHAVFLVLPDTLAWGERRDPPDAFANFLLTLHELCASGRVRALGYRPTGKAPDALTPVPAADWSTLYFDSDGKQLRSGDLFSGVLRRCRAWVSVRFSLADLVREWPKSGAAAFVAEPDKYCADCSKQTIRERRRREWIDRFAAKQRIIRRWISFVEIADACGRAARPVTILEEDEARTLAYHRLVESVSKGEFEQNGRSRVLLLRPNLIASVRLHRLTREYFQGMVDFYGLTDFGRSSQLVCEHLQFCWLPSDLCRAWFEHHLIAWPGEFIPKYEPPVGRGGNHENRTKIERITKPAPDAATPNMGRRGRKPGSGSFEDDHAVQRMLCFLAKGEASSVHAAARRTVASGDVKGTGTEESAVTRLRRKFTSKFGTEPGVGKTWSDIAFQSEEK
jgi:hypothetical protein